MPHGLPALDQSNDQEQQLASAPNADPSSLPASQSRISDESAETILREQIDSLQTEMLLFLKRNCFSSMSVSVGTIAWVMVYYLYSYAEPLGVPGYIALSLAEGLASNLASLPFSYVNFRHEKEKPSRWSAFKQALSSSIKYVFFDGLYQFVYDAIVFLGKNKSFRGEFVLNEAATFSGFEIMFGMIAFGGIYSGMDYAQSKCFEKDSSFKKSLKLGPQYCTFYFNDFFFNVGEKPTLKNIGNLCLSAAAMGGYDFLVNTTPKLSKLLYKKRKLKMNYVASLCVSVTPARDTKSIYKYLNTMPLLQEPLLAHENPETKKSNIKNTKKVQQDLVTPSSDEEWEWVDSAAVCKV